MLDPGLGLLVVARAHVDDVAELRRAQEARAGEGTDEGHARLGGDRLGRARGRRADPADQGEDLILRDQGLGVRDRALRLVAVVVALQPELPAGDAALAVAIGRASCRERVCKYV